MADPTRPRDSVRPRQRSRVPPCQVGCLTGSEIRSWIGTIAQRGRLGLSLDEARARAWRTIVEVNPFPAVLGRICPHPCESGCNRREVEGAVAINRLERFLGDWAIERGLPLERVDAASRSEGIGVIGAGPAGLSFAYQMARRGYRVTVYEGADRAGGMLRHGIPDYRLPPRILEAEIRRILDLGVELRLSTRVGAGPSLRDVQARHDVVFVGIGAQRGLPLDLPGEQGHCSWLATDYLRRINAGQRVDLGRRVVVVGGGNTAIDAARAARRRGSEVLVLYRRSRVEMPARAEEVDEAREEGVRFEFLAAPLRLSHRNGSLCGVVVQRMRLGEPDRSGRRAPLPLPGAVREIRADALIAAVSQTPDWTGLEALRDGARLVAHDEPGRVTDRLWVAGDVTDLGAAGRAIGRARAAAEALHARLRGLERPATGAPAATGRCEVKPEYYPPLPRSVGRVLAAPDRLARSDAEVHRGLTERQFLREVRRCMSCGQCFGCEHCWIYCVHGCFARSEEARSGAYFELRTDGCQSCGKCIDVCPCGFLEPAPTEEG